MRVRSVILWLVGAMLVVPALLLTLTRAFEPDGARWVQLEAFTPLALVLYALLVLLVVVFRRHQAATIVVTAVALSGLGFHVWWFSPMLTGANPPAPDGAETLTVMTANMNFGEADGIELVQAASDEGVDVLVVQEVTESLLGSMEEAGLEALFEHRAGEPGELAEGTMVFANVELGEPTPVDTAWDSLLVEAGDLTLLAVHPHAPTDVERWRENHDLLNATVTTERPDLVVGDFNATPDHAPMRDLAEAGWRSATELANDGWQPTWSLSGYVDDAGLPLPALVQIDDVLVGRGLASRGTHTVDLVDSDHRALVAEVAVK
ncbi:MAG: endonuclease/exonuclease/phosphatase family protein [Nocardioides sp.]